MKYSLPILMFLLLAGLNNYGETFFVELLPELGAVQVVDEGGQVIADTVNGASVTHPALVYNDAGLLERVLSPETEYYLQYDNKGRVALVVDLREHSHRDITYQKTGEGLRVTVWDSEQGETVYLYTPFRITIRETPHGSRKSTETMIDRVIGERLIAAPDGTQIRLKPDGSRMRVLIVGPQGATATGVFDENDRLAESAGDVRLLELMSSEKTGFSEQQEYLRRIEPLLDIEYDENGYSTTVKQKDFDVQIESRAQDGIEQLIWYESLQFGKWFFRYPGYEPRVVRIAPGGAMTFYQYDDENRLKTVTDGHPQTLAAYQYNIAGQLVKATTPGSAFVRSYDRFGRLEKETDEETGFYLTYTYTANGLLAKAGQTVSFTYDKQNRVTNVESSVFGTFQIRYNRQGLPEQITRPNGLASVFEYNDDACLSGMYFYYPKTKKRTKKKSYACDADGRITRINTAWKNTIYRQDEYGHRAGRIIGAKKYPESFDPWGNLQQDRGTLKYDRNGRPVSWNNKDVRCDDYGRLIQLGGLHFSYDWNNRLAAVKDGYKGRWTYDAFGRLYRFKTDREDLRFFFCGEYPYACVDVEESKVRHYLFVPGFANCFAWTDEQGQKLYPVWDGAGKVLFAQDEKGESVLIDKRADENGGLGVRSGLSFVHGTLLYWNNRFFCPELNRAMAMPALQPFEPTLHLDNPVSFGDERLPRVVYRKEGGEL